MNLFEPQFNVDQSPPDDTRVTTVLLYYSEEEAREFKRLCKLGMLHMYPTTFRDSNVSDFILTLLKKVYGENNSEAGDL